MQNRVSLAEPQLPAEVRSPGRQRQEEVVGAAAGHRADLAGRALRPAVPQQLRHHQHHRQPQAHPRRRRRRAVHAGRLQHADLARHRPPDQLRPDARATSSTPIKAPEHPGGGRPDRRAARAARPAVPAQHPDQGPAHQRRGVRQHRRARQSGRLVRARPRRGAGRAWRAQSRNRDRPAGRQPGGGDRHLPVARAAMRIDSADAGASDARRSSRRRSRRASTTRSPTTPRCSSRRASARWCTR